MLSSIRVLEQRDERFVDFLTGLNGGSSGLRITDVKGLEPVKADVRFTQRVMVPGGDFNSAVINERNIVITAELHPNYEENLTVQDIRRALYKVCMPGTDVRIRLYNDGSYESRVDGYVESVEPVIFAKEPTVQVSIICMSPYFRSPSETVLADLTPQIRTIEYNSDIPWGLTLDIRPNRTIQWIEIQDFEFPIDTRPTIRINNTFEAGQRVRVVTTPGSKEISLRRDSDGLFLQALIGQANVTNGWPQLYPGHNRIRVRGSQNDSLLWDCIMVSRYGGF